MYGEETDLSSDHSNEARGRFRRIEAVKGRAISSFESFNKSVERNEEQEESKSRFELSWAISWPRRDKSGISVATVALVLARNPRRDGKGGRIDRGKGRVWVYTETRKEAGKGRATGLKITWPMLECALRNNPLDDDESKQCWQTIEEKGGEERRGEERARRQRTPGTEVGEGGLRGFAESGGTEEELLEESARVSYIAV